MPDKIKLKAVILVPYVASSLGADVPHAEAEYFYKHYFYDSETYQVIGSTIEGRLYIKDDVALYITGEGKTNSVLNTTALLSYYRFDLENTKFILCGCCGSARDLGVAGDIYFISDAVDYDLGHFVDIRDKQNQDGATWYPNKTFCRYGYIDLRNKFLNQAYLMFKDINVPTTKHAKNFMAKTFNNESWAIRNPKVMQGVSVTSDSYWKGDYSHERAVYLCKYYKCKSPFLASQMEDIAVAQVFKKFRKLEDFLIIRYSVNMDVFMSGQVANNLWDCDKDAFVDSAVDNFDDIFPVATKTATDIVWSIVNKI